MLDLHNPEIRTEMNEVMREIVQSSQQRLDDKLRKHLNPAESALLDYIRDFKFDGGKWYRPIHDVICTITGLRIVNAEDYPRDLVLPIIIHDAGYVNIKFDEDIIKAEQTKNNKREQHMYDGAVMANAVFHMLRSQGLIDLPDERIDDLVAMIGVHDNPYIGKEIEGREANVIRDADRSYVPSISSWYKDLVSHHGNDKYHQKAANLGEEVNTNFFLRARMAAFWAGEEDIPERWPSSIYPLETRLDSYSGGGKCEPQFTQKGKEIINEFMESRLYEMSEFPKNNGRSVFNNLQNVKEFGEYFDVWYHSELFEQLSRLSYELYA